MKRNHWIVLLGVLAVASSCIKSEPLNAEADIVKCELPEGAAKSEPKITNEEVMAFIIPGAVDIKTLAPKFELTSGAKISPASGTVRDFSVPQTYTVTSEDGKWTKTYTVRITEDDMPTRYEFENWKQGDKYEMPYEMKLYEVQDIWASGNSAYAIIGGNDPSKYPTCSTTDAHGGKLAAKLETKSTGFWGTAMGMPIAAGNLFIGTFDGANATSKPLEATHFGLPFGRKPLKLTGYYRYISGGNVTDKKGNEIVPARRDKGNIYAVLYETDDQVKYLNGANVLTSPNIVARAMVTDMHEISGNEYELFTADFVYEKELDPQKLKDYKYSLAVVFTASERGDYFEGAAGSTLWIDDVEVLCNE